MLESQYHIYTCILGLKKGVGGGSPRGGGGSNGHSDDGPHLLKNDQDEAMTEPMLHSCKRKRS